MQTSVWTVPTRPYKGHRAVFPPELIAPCILAGSRPGDIVLDPFAGAGSTLAAAEAVGYESIGDEKDEHFFCMACEAIPRLIRFNPSGSQSSR